VGEFSIVAEERAATGKGAARKLRATGRIPAVVYGRGKTSRTVSVDPAALAQVLRKAHSGINTLIDLALDSGETVVLVREIQKDPVSGQWVHADLFEVDLQQTLQVRVPLHFVGKARGVEFGGILDHPMRELEIECLPRAIPNAIEVDVSDLDVGDSIHVRELALPEGAQMISDLDLAVASVVLPKSEEAAPAEAAAVAAEGAPAEAAATPAEGEAEE
jgi:large subunit ribosomal protein L25